MMWVGIALIIAGAAFIALGVAAALHHPHGGSEDIEHTVLTGMSLASIGIVILIVWLGLWLTRSELANLGSILVGVA